MNNAVPATGHVELSSCAGPHLLRHMSSAPVHQPNHLQTSALHPQGAVRQIRRQSKRPEGCGARLAFYQGPEGLLEPSSAPYPSCSALSRPPPSSSQSAVLICSAETRRRPATTTMQATLAISSILESGEGIHEHQTGAIAQRLGLYNDAG